MPSGELGARAGRRGRSAPWPSPGIGLALAGRLRGEVNLAAANGLYLVLLLLGGMVFPLDELPAWLRAVSPALPSGAALAEVLRAALTDAAQSRAGMGRAAWPGPSAAPVLAARPSAGSEPRFDVSRWSGRHQR